MPGFHPFYISKNLVVYLAIVTVNNFSCSCVLFIAFSGCGGNHNNFASLSDCENRCNHHLGKERSVKQEKSKFRSKNLPTNPVCLLPVEVGPCEALIPGFFFNTQTKRCESFVYGGCRGNGNRFSTREDCESACSLPSQTGWKSYL